MKIFISNKFRGISKKSLRKNLELIGNVLHEDGHKTFNLFRDADNWQSKEMPPGEAIRMAFNEIKKCDAILCFINHKEPSEGLLLEFGFAKALKKRIILLIGKKYSSSCLEMLSDKVLKFDSLGEIAKKLKNI